MLLISIPLENALSFMARRASVSLPAFETKRQDRAMSFVVEKGYAPGCEERRNSYREMRHLMTIRSLKRRAVRELPAA
jgi:hypothetical protein